MKNSNTCRYCVAMKKGRKIFNLVVGSLMLFLSSIVVVLTTIFYVSEQEMDFYVFLGALLIPLLFIIFGVIGIISATKRVEVHKGKIIYHIGVKNKEYRMSDIRTSKTQIETCRTGLDYGNSVPLENYDKITVFYDKAGKKVFKFELAYYNVERLKADVKNTQKSISKQQRIQ